MKAFWRTLRYFAALLLTILIAAGVLLSVYYGLQDQWGRVASTVVTCGIGGCVGFGLLSVFGDLNRHCFR